MNKFSKIIFDVFFICIVSLFAVMVGIHLAEKPSILMWIVFIFDVTLLVSFIYFKFSNKDLL